MEEIKDKLRQIFVKALRLNIAPDKVGDNHLVEQLGIDSINSLEILIWVENDFGITIEDEDLSAQLVDSLGNLAAYVRSRIPQLEGESR